MKLTELNARWSNAYGQNSGKRQGMLVVFDCPCRESACGYSPVIIALKNPLDGKPQSMSEHRNKWHREGESIETLTLSPEISLSNHWRGRVVAGSVITEK